MDLVEWTLVSGRLVSGVVPKARDVLLHILHTESLLLKTEFLER